MKKRLKEKGQREKVKGERRKVKGGAFGRWRLEVGGKDEGRGKMDDGGQKDFFIKYYNIDGSTRNGIFR